MRPFTDSYIAGVSYSFSVSFVAQAILAKISVIQWPRCLAGVLLHALDLCAVSQLPFWCAEGRTRYLLQSTAVRVWYAYRRTVMSCALDFPVLGF